ncbi:MAG: hypothetical protein Q4P31_02300 [Andreesenia angusta]|nr:hypothetical protein [Andreesenia angusta]
MYIEKANINDIDRLKKIYSDARKFMSSGGNAKQWKDNYPPEEVILNDINKNRLYKCILDNRIVGVFALLFEDEEESYKDIYDGEWINDDPYYIIHRIASSRDTKGVGTFCIEWCVNEFNNIKIDTHDDNIPMQNLLKKLKFHKCGKIINAEDGTPRIAYQKTK